MRERRECVALTTTSNPQIVVPWCPKQPHPHRHTSMKLINSQTNTPALTPTAIPSPPTPTIIPALSPELIRRTEPAAAAASTTDDPSELHRRGFHSKVSILEPYIIVAQTTRRRILYIYAGRANCGGDGMFNIYTPT